MSGFEAFLIVMVLIFSLIALLAILALPFSGTAGAVVGHRIATHYLAQQNQQYQQLGYQQPQQLGYGYGRQELPSPQMPQLEPEHIVRHSACGCTALARPGQAGYRIVPCQTHARQIQQQMQSPGGYYQ